MNDTETLVTNIDLDLSGVSARPPLLPEQTLKCRVGDSGVSLTKEKKRRMVIPLILEEPGKDTHGNPVAVGFRLTNSFLIDESGGWTKERGAEELLRCKMAIEGISEQEAKSTPTDTSKWAGRFVLAKISIDKKGENQNFRLEAVQG